MNGIDRFLPQTVLDARVMSTGAKPGDGTGTKAESGTASAFGSHLNDLYRQEDMASNSPAVGGCLNHAVPAFVQRSFLPATGMAEAAGQGTSEPETAVLVTPSVIASPPASGKSPDAAIFGTRSATGSGRPPAAAIGSVAAGASRGVRKDALTEGTLVPGGVKSPPTGHRPASTAIRAAHTHALPGSAETVATSPLPIGIPVLSAIMAGSQVKEDSSDGTAVSRDAVLAGTASGFGTIGETTSLGALPASGSAGKLPLTPGSASVRVSIVDQQTHFAPSAGFLPSQHLAYPKGEGAPVAVTGDTRGPASTGITAPAVGEITPDNAMAQHSVELHARHTADSALAPVRVSIVHQQTSLALAIGLSPAQQIGESVIAGVSSNALDASAATVQSSPAPDISGVAGSMSKVQTMQVQLDPENLGKVTVRMRIAGSRLDLRVETERPETTQLIGKEKDLLAGKLQDAGYSLESVVIQPAERQVPHEQTSLNASPNGQDQSTGPSTGPSTGQANGGQSAHDRPSTHEDRQRSRLALADETQDGAGVRLPGGDLYI